MKMNEKMEWLKYQIKNECAKRYRRLHFSLVGNNEYIYHKSKCDGKVVLNASLTHNKICEMLLSDNPVMICRFGNNELTMMVRTLEHRMFKFKDEREKALDAMCGIAGFFPHNFNSSDKFVDLMLESCKDVDMLGQWGLYMEDYIIHKYLDEAILTQLGYLEPWTEKKDNTLPWSHALKGKKVLVIHPFEQSIINQYDKNRREIFSKIYDADDILPEFELKTLKAVQTMGGNGVEKYDSWFEALKYMEDACSKIDFDIAIIGCGAYGFPLASYIKRSGKKAVHLGGATQLLFGIIGSRWERYPDFVSRVVNESWVRPMEIETVSHKDKFEKGCYW